jgi:copper(I)-binding protein
MTTPRTTRRPGRRAIGAALVTMALLAACGSDDDSSGETTTTAPPTAEVEVTDAWARTSPAVATAGAVYMTITNTGELADVLVGAAVAPSVARTVELHETVEGQGDDSMSTTTAMGGDMTTTTGMGGGMMTMQPVDEIPVPAGETVTLEPGGYHVMLLELAEPLEVGTTITVTLTFEQSGPVEVTADVRDTAP